MKAKYLIRLDDICPTMFWDSFLRLEQIFDHYQIKPIVGIIPNNKDRSLEKNLPRVDFWEKMRSLHQKDWVIAQHGYTHEYRTNNGGILNINKKSEFSGLPYTQQLEKIKAGKEILEKQLLSHVRWWMAPAHSFDKTTCRILKELGFQYITDGIALFPFIKFDLLWVPQQLWKPKKKWFGLWTICIHPNTLKEKDFIQLENFIKNNLSAFEFDIAPRYTLLNALYYYWWNFEYLIFKLIKKK